MEDEPRTLLSESRTLRRMDIRNIAKTRKRRDGDCIDRFGFAKTSLDLHADTSCVGSSLAILELTSEKVDVFPCFSDNLPYVQEVSIATVLTIWESPEIGEPWMLVVREALYFGERLKDSLLCPNQLRAAGNIATDAPIQFNLIPLDHDSRAPGAPTRNAWSCHLYLSTRKPSNDEIARYKAGSLNSLGEANRQGTLGALPE